MIYNKGTGENEGWLLTEEVFPVEHPEKTESIMCLGNGYMGVRATNEEYVHLRSRCNFVAGTFDLLGEGAVTELPNNVDVTNMTFTVDGEVVDPVKNNEGWEKVLNIRTGLLRRTFSWVSESGKKVTFEFLRVVSLKDLHLIAAKVNVTADADCEIGVVSGIEGDVVGKEHFEPIGINAVDGVLNITTKTRQSGIYFSTMTSHSFELNGVKLDVEPEYVSEGMTAIKAEISFDVKAGMTLSVNKISNVFTSRDKERNDCSASQLVSDAREHMASVKNRKFEDIAKESADEWESKVWSYRDVVIDSKRCEDQLAIRFAIYHLTVMSPVHDNRMNIGAKGLSGFGYKGHTFWDTEIFMLPYFIFTNTEEARSLLEYRYNCIEASREIARSRGYKGAMYPWEAAWITDGEVTPHGVKTGLYEQHITADVAASVYYYYVVTGDEDFMEKGGYEIILDTAKFWSSRLEYNAELDRYEINMVIGPDEYKEDVNNNAYTNYLAQYNIQLAIDYSDKLKANKPETYARLNKILDIDSVYVEWCDRVNKIYLPRENEDGLVPQDDTYLTLIDITREDCTLSEMSKEAHELSAKYGYQNTQMSKQADTMLLMYLFEDLFTPEVKKKNFYFYEKRCLHDSSLSLSTYSALAADLGEKETAYRLYQRASMIDMGECMWSSHEGIHSASLGGIWQCTVLGFMGVRRYGENLRIQPNLPDNWTSATAKILWQGQRLKITVTHDTLTVENLTATKDISFLCGGTLHAIGDKITLKYKEAAK